MRKKLAIVLLFVSVFLIIGGVVVMNYTPYVFKTALINYKNTLFSNEQAEKLFPMEVMKISKAKKSSSLSFNINDVNQVHNINLVNDYSYDKNDKKLYGDCKLSYNSLVNLELEYLQKDNKTSFTLKNIFDNYYYIYNDILELKDFTYEDLVTIYESFFKAVGNNMNNKKLVKVRQSIKLGEKNVRVQKISVEVTEKDKANIYISVLKDIQNNKKLLEKLAKVFQDDNVDQYKKYLDDQIKALKEEYNSQEKLFDYNVYVKNLKVLRHEIVSNNDTYLLDTYLDSDRKSNMTFTYNEGSKKVLNFNAVNEKENKVRVKLEDENKNVSSGIYEYDGQKVNFTMTTSNAKKAVLGTVIYTLNKEDDTTYNSSLDLEMKKKATDENSFIKLVYKSNISSISEVNVLETKTPLKRITTTDEEKLITFVQNNILSVMPLLSFNNYDTSL
jgi:hypothetical protein